MKSPSSPKVVPNDKLSTEVGYRLLARTIADKDFDYVNALSAFQRYFNHGGWFRSPKMAPWERIVQAGLKRPRMPQEGR